MTEDAPTCSFEIAQARRAAYGLISRGFQYPDRQLVEAIADPARWMSWPEVLERAVPETAEPLAAVRTLLERVSCSRNGKTTTEGSPRRRGSSMTQPIDLQETFNRLFGHAVRGKCPPYELEYGRSEIIQMASFLADVAGFYAAFGMEVSDDAADRADHLAVEAEFMSVLCAKEAYAIENGEADHQAISVGAQRDFLKDHLARWLPAFTHRVKKADPSGFYGALAAFASALVAAECGRFDIKPGPQRLQLRPVAADLDASINCGSTACKTGSPAEDLVQLSGGGRDTNQ